MMGDMELEQEETGVDGKEETKVAREAVVQKEAKEKEEAVEPCPGDVVRRGRDIDGAARTGQDPPVQAGRQESIMGAAEGRYWWQTWGKRCSTAQSPGKGRAATRTV
jgi:hypothetical protein